MRIITQILLKFGNIGKQFPEILSISQKIGVFSQNENFYSNLLKFSNNRKQFPGNSIHFPKKIGVFSKNEIFYPNLQKNSNIE